MIPRLIEAITRPAGWAPDTELKRGIIRFGIEQYSSAEANLYNTTSAQLARTRDRLLWLIKTLADPRVSNAHLREMDLPANTRLGGDNFQLIFADYFEDKPTAISALENSPKAAVKALLETVATELDWAIRPDILDCQVNQAFRGRAGNPEKRITLPITPEMFIAESVVPDGLAIRVWRKYDNLSYSLSLVVSRPGGME